MCKTRQDRCRESIKKFFEKPQPLQMTPTDWANYDKDTHCYICNKLIEVKLAKKNLVNHTLTKRKITAT